MARKRIQQPEIVQRFAECLRETRKRLSMSQQDLAFKAHVNTGYIGKLERAESAPGLDMVGRIAEALGVEAVSLVAGLQIKKESISTVKAQVRKQVDRLLTREDSTALQSVAVVIGLVDNALARQNVR